MRITHYTVDTKPGTIFLTPFLLLGDVLEAIYNTTYDALMMGNEKSCPWIDIRIIPPVVGAAFTVEVDTERTSDLYFVEPHYAFESTRVNNLDADAVTSF